jgi:hypothetical protein
MAFLWVKQQRDNIQPPVKHTPVYSKPFKPADLAQLYEVKEGFQGVSGTSRGSGSGSGSSAKSPWPSQFDLSPTQQALYGTWEPTPFDTYYNAYEEAEMYAAATQLLKFNDISPAPSAPPDFGSSLGAFDSDTTRIPWDNDNASYQQKDVVWGYVSEQASRSIFLKTYVNQLAAASDSFIPCSEADPSNYCYKSPLFDVSVYDSKLATLTKTGETVVQAVGMLPMMYLSEVNFNMSNFTEVRMARQKAIGGLLDAAKSATSHALGPVRTVSTKVGNALGLGVGARKVLSKFKSISDKIAAQFRTTLKTTQATTAASKNIIMTTVNAAAAAGGVAAVVSSGTATPAAVLLGWVAVGVDLFFGVFGGIMMGIEAIIEPMMAALLNTGGVCPANYQAITDLVPTPVLMALSAFIPLVPFLQMFDPYVCWGKDSHGLGNVRLRIPPKVPPFMSDRTLSLVYHAAWQTGSNPAIPSPTSLSFMLDPLPPGYVWLEQSDLANSPNVNELTDYAQKAAQAAQGSSINPVANLKRGSGSSTLPSNIAVKTCEDNTTPSADGKQCIKNQMQNGSTMPTLSPCPTGKTDDGYNCWNAKIDTNCTGGKISYTTTQTWNDTTGYFQVTTTPLVCNPDATSQCYYPCPAGTTQSPTDPLTCFDGAGSLSRRQLAGRPPCPAGAFAVAGTITPANTNIAVNYKDRLRCPATFPNRLETELLCFANCPSGFIRKGALCVGTTETYDRTYMFGTSTMYREQKFNADLLKDLSDVTIPYCDFSKTYMLDKMAQFYYKNSLQNPVINEDGTIQIQMITKFFGVIASSELSCDVVCSIDFITYDPVTGGKYTSYTGCSYPDDDTFEGCAFCYRRFYFIRTGTEKYKDEFTVTGCTWADYTAPEAMVQSSDTGTNPVASLPKKFEVFRKDGSIVDYARFNAAWSSGQIMAQAGAGLMNAGITIGAGMLGAVGGGAIGAAAGRAAVNSGIKASANNIARNVVKESGEKFAEKEAIELAANVAKGLAKEGPEVATNMARAAGMSGKDAATLVAQAQKDLATLAARESRGNIIGGLVSGVGGGLFTSLYLNPLLQNTFAGALPPADVDGAANTFITGKDMYNLQVATNNNWWTANQGPIYELAAGVIPTINFCDGAKIPVSYCTHKYVVRDMVNKYHNENQRSHIKQILAIEPRGVDGCYYKWNEVDYAPETNTEQIVMKEKEVILSHALADYATCTFKPTSFTTNINDPAYPVRSYVDPSTQSLPVPRVIYPTRNTVYTSDLFARYVRVRPALPGTTSGSGTGALYLAQISVFDVSGFNVSTQLPTYGTSTAVDAGPADTVVNGTSAQGDMLSTVWKPATLSTSTEYWEVDLGKIVNISEVMYFGGTFDDAIGCNQGVRIEFLYTNGATDTPILTSVLPIDEPVQLVKLFSSSYMTPTFPIAGPIKVPRPIAPGQVLGIEFGCMNRCEDKVVIDSLVKQYNDTSLNGNIIKVLRGITPNSTTCEYDVHLVKTDVDAGSSSTAKNTVTRQIVSMQIAPTAVKGFGRVFARFIKITPSGTPGTVLEFSKILVRNTVRGGNYTTAQHFLVSTGKNINAFNTFFELKEIYSSPTSTNPYDLSTMGFLMAPPDKYNYDYTTIDADSFPNVWRASDNQDGTFFEIDLLPPGAGVGTGGNYEIYDIVFIGCSDRTLGGLRGVKIELFPDRPGDESNSTTAGIATPTFTYYLPTDDIKQRILVEPPSKCEFVLSQTDMLKTPVFLQDNSPAFSAVDTSGGVFSFSSILDTVKSAWSSLAPVSPTAMVAPIQTNLQQSNKIVHQMLDTMAATKTLLSSSSKCSDPGILKLMMTAYNIQKGAPVDGEFNITKQTMLRILKAGQSTPSTCDILFENLEEGYDDYIEDITNKANIIKSVKAARFKFNSLSATQVVPDPTSIVYDISANALGILSDSSALSPVYTGPTCAMDCGNPVQINIIASKLASQTGPKNTATGVKRTKFINIQQTFQNSPLSCEYKMSKNTSTLSKITGTTVTTTPVDTYVKAVFTLHADGCTPLLSSVKEYDPAVISYSSDYSRAYLNGAEVTLPSLYGYDPTKLVSTRVDSTVKNIS